MVTHQIASFIETNDSIPLIDEEFDTFSFDLTSSNEWDALACDEAWDEYLIKAA